MEGNFLMDKFGQQYGLYSGCENFFLTVKTVVLNCLYISKCSRGSNTKTKNEHGRKFIVEMDVRIDLS